MSGHAKSGHVMSGQVQLKQVKSVQYNLGQVKSNGIKLRNFNSGQVESGQVKSCLDRSSHIRTGQVKSSQQHFYLTQNIFGPTFVMVMISCFYCIIMRSNWFKYNHCCIQYPKLFLLRLLKFVFQDFLYQKQKGLISNKHILTTQQ